MHEVIMDGYVAVPAKIYVPFWMACMTTAIGVTVFYTWGWVLIALGLPLPLSNINSMRWYFHDCRNLAKLFFTINITLVSYILLKVIYPELSVIEDISFNIFSPFFIPA